MKAINMRVKQRGIAMITGSRPENLGKTVFVVGCPDDPRLPCLGGDGQQCDVQMLAIPLVGSDGEEYLRGAIGEDCLMPLDVPSEQAAEMREHALLMLLQRAVAEEPWEEFGDDDWEQSP
jgi:hypothetical protein